MDGNDLASSAPPSTFAPPPLAPPPSMAPPLEPMTDRSLSAVLDALLRSPARLLSAVRDGGIVPKLIVITVIGLAATGIAMSTWSGGPQMLIAPLKLALLALVTAFVCLPSLHVLSALSGGAQPIRETVGAMSMGVALTAVLALALAPIAWVLSAATSSLALAGSLYLVVFLIAAVFGLGLVRRALAASAGTHIRGLGAWSFMFVIVALQLATTLRPIVGPFDGLVLHDRTFFLSHFADCLGS